MIWLNSFLGIKLLDTTDNHTIHIRVNSSLDFANNHIRLFLFEHIINSTYQNASIKEKVDQYGLITDLYVKFNSINDAVHFKLVHNL